MVLPTDFATAIARTGVDPTLPARALEDALQLAITNGAGYRGDWRFGKDSPWHVELLWPERERFGGRTLADALAWFLVWLMG